MPNAQWHPSNHTPRGVTWLARRCGIFYGESEEEGGFAVTTQRAGHNGHNIGTEGTVRIFQKIPIGKWRGKLKIKLNEKIKEKN